MLELDILSSITWFCHLLTSSVTSGQLLDFAEPHFLNYKMEMIIKHGYHEDKINKNLELSQVQGEPYMRVRLLWAVYSYLVLTSIFPECRDLALFSFIFPVFATVLGT